MKKYLKKKIPHFLISILVILVIIYIWQSTDSLTNNNYNNIIENATDEWIKRVVVEHNPERIAKLFCDDGVLIGTVSQIKRHGIDIKKYFDYFAKLPNIKVIKKKYNVRKIDDTVYVNNAFITWKWGGLDEPVVARMTFIYRIDGSRPCIFLLNSSVLPELNQSLLDISGKK